MAIATQTAGDVFPLGLPNVTKGDSVRNINGK